MTTPSLLYLSRAHVAQCLSLSETIHAVEAAFQQSGTGAAQQSPKITLSPSSQTGSIKAMSAYAKKMQQQLCISVTPVPTYREAVQDADIVVTATTGQGSFVHPSWLRSGTTILKVGSHRELAPSVLQHLDKIVVDSWQHTAATTPEIRDAQLTRDDIHAELAEIVTHQKKGRLHPSERILFISLGMAIEDAGAAYLAYRKAQHLNVGIELDL